MSNEVIWPGGARVAVKTPKPTSETLYVPTPAGWIIKPPVEPKANR